jgi:hypothetical protein
MEVVGDFVFFSQGRKLLSLEIPSSKIRSHLCHTDEITSLVQSNGSIFTGSSDSTIIKWSLPNISKYNTSSPVHLMCASPNEIFYLKASGQSLSRLDQVSERFEQTDYFKGQVEDAISLQITSDFKQLVLLKRFTLLMIHVDSLVTRKFESPVPLNTMQVHPNSDYVAVGDCTGQIVKVYEKYTTKVHWHAHKVECLGFTNDCNFMLSGGEEGVVVIWHENSTEKSFLPRLGSAISHIKVNDNNDHYIVRLLNGMLKVFRTADHKQVASFSCLVNPSKVLPGAKVYKCEFSDENVLTLNGSPGFLQSFDLVSKELKQFDCESRNSILRAKETYPFPFHIISWARVGETFATLQSSASPYLKIQKIKFWKDDRLVSIVLHPHNDSCHSLLNFQQSLVSLGRNSFVFYSEKGNGWVQVVERKFEELKPLAACVAFGALFVAFQSFLTEWDEGLEILNSFSEPFGENIEQIVVAGQLLALRTFDMVHLWKGLILRSVQLGFIHRISSTDEVLLVSLNGSPYAPLDVRKSNSNILIKFDLDSLKPLKVYKTDSPAWSGLDKKNNTLIISKLFEFQNLDQDPTSDSDILPRYQRTLNEEPVVKTSQKQVHSFYSNSKSSFLDAFSSFDLPSADTIFNQIVLG